MKTTFILLAFLSFVVTTSGLTACSQLRDRTANSVQVGLNCATPALRDAASQGYALVRAAIVAAIRQDGSVDRNALRDVGKGLVDVGWQCAFASAIAALSAPPRHASDAPQSLGLEIDGVALRAAAREIAVTDWNVSSVKLSDGVL